MLAPRTTLTLLLALIATLGVACLGDLSGGALFVDEPSPLADPTLLEAQDLSQGQGCASSQNCASGLRCVRRGDRQTCEDTCLADQDCGGDLICRRALNDSEQGWCGLEPVLGEGQPAPGAQPGDSPDPTDDEPEEFNTPEVVPSQPDNSGAGGDGCQEPLVQAQLRALNGDRAAQGLSALCCHAGLASVARAHSRDMAQRGYFDHTTPEGLEPWDRMQDAGVTGWTNAGENIAYGYDSAEAVQEGWMDSPGHRANILTPGFTHVGVGTWQEVDGARHWTQLFATFPGLRCEP